MISLVQRNGTGCWVAVRSESLFSNILVVKSEFGAGVGRLEYNLGLQKHGQADSMALKVLEAREGYYQDSLTSLSPEVNGGLKTS